MFVPLHCEIEDPGTQEELRRIVTSGNDWRSRWVARCLRTSEFRLRLAAILTPHEREGWHLERFHSVEPTKLGVVAILVLEAGPREPARSARQ